MHCLREQGVEENLLLVVEGVVSVTWQQLGSIQALACGLLPPQPGMETEKNPTQIKHAAFHNFFRMKRSSFTMQ